VNAEKAGQGNWHNAGSKSEETEINEKPELTITGAAAVHCAFAHPSVTYSSETAKKIGTDVGGPRIAGGEANIAFKIKGQLKNGTKYGAVIDVDTVKGDTGVDKMYLLFERDNVGTVHIGNVKGPEATMLCGGQQLIGGTCGVDGTITKDMDYATGVISPIYVVGYTNKATKVVYYTPTIYGFQFGFAYTPDTKHVGHEDRNRNTGDSHVGNDKGLFVKGKDDKERPSGKDHISLALKHQHAFPNGFGTKIAVVYLRDNIRKVKTHHHTVEEKTETEVPLRNTSSYHVTATASYKQIEVGCGYLNNGKSRLPTKEAHSNDRIGGFIAQADSNSGSAWNIGARYTLGDWRFAAVYHSTSRKVTTDQKTRGHMFTVTAEYKVCDGLLLFAELDNVNTRSCDKACEIRNKSADPADKDKVAIKKQKCVLLAIGAKVSF
jgi:predicted porin